MLRVVIAWSACDHEGRRRFVAMKTKELALVANVKQYASDAGRGVPGAP